YAQLTSQARTTPLLRQLNIRRAGHCTFTPAERIIALQTLARRINTGHWTKPDPATLNHAATALGPTLNVLTEIESTTSNPPNPPTPHPAPPPAPPLPPPRVNATRPPGWLTPTKGRQALTNPAADVVGTPRPAPAGPPRAAGPADASMTGAAIAWRSRT